MTNKCHHLLFILNVLLSSYRIKYRYAWFFSTNNQIKVYLIDYKIKTYKEKFDIEMFML